MEREEACRRKRYYLSRKWAKRAARHIARETGRRVRPYRCPCCDGYHLTTVAKGEPEE